MPDFSFLTHPLGSLPATYPHDDRLVGQAVSNFLLDIIENFVVSLTCEALRGEICQNALALGGGGSLWAKISHTRGHPWGFFFVSGKTR